MADEVQRKLRHIQMEMSSRVSTPYEALPSAVPCQNHNALLCDLCCRKSIDHVDSDSDNNGDNNNNNDNNHKTCVSRTTTANP